jgi:putative ABC transport system ATP-binding protein
MKNTNGSLVQKDADLPATRRWHVTGREAELKGLHVKEVLKLENVTKRYSEGESGVTAVSDIDFTVHRGELTGILGPSGSGKSTLLHLMGLLDRPTAGKIYIDGIDTTRMAPDEQARVRGKKIGFVFQAFNLVPSLSAQENVELPLVIYDVPADVRREKARAILNRLGLGARMHHLPSQLSGGERQRVAIARALINDPEVILADEPTGNLDSKTGGSVLDIMEGLHHEGKTIIIVTHDESIVRIAEKLLRIKDGRLVKSEVLV